MEKGYTFIRGVDGFGADTDPAYEEGVFLDYEKAFNHLVELTENAMQYSDYPFYEKGYDEEHYPKRDKIMKRLEKEEKWGEYYEELEKHRLTNPREIALLINEDYDEPPFGFYQMVEVNIIE